MMMEPAPEQGKGQDLNGSGTPANDFDTAEVLSSQTFRNDTVSALNLLTHFDSFYERIVDLAQQRPVRIAISYAREALDFFSTNPETHIRCLLLNAQLSAMDPAFEDEVVPLMEHGARIIRANGYQPGNAEIEFALEYFTVFSKLGRRAELSEFLESVVESMSGTEFARDERVRLLRGQLGTFYMQSGNIELAESHLLHSMMSPPEGEQTSDAVTEIGRLRLGQYFRVEGKPDLAEPLLRQAQAYFLTDIENSYDPKEVATLGIEASLALISIETSQQIKSGDLRFPEISDRLDFLDQVAQKFLPYNSIESTNIDIYRVDLQRQLGYRDSIQSQMLDILRIEIECGRQSGAGANGVRILLGSTAAGAARTVDQFYTELYRNIDLPLGSVIPPGNLRPLSSVLKFAQDLDLETSFKRFLPDNPVDGLIEAQTMFTAFRSVIDESLKQAVGHFEEFLSYGCTPFDTVNVLVRMRDLYEDLRRTAGVAALNDRIRLFQKSVGMPIDADE